MRRWKLWPQRDFFLYTATLLVFHCFVFHDDMSRYLLSIAPFALLVGFDSTLAKPWFRPLAAGLALASSIYAWGMLQHNLMSPELYEGLLRALR